MIYSLKNDVVALDYPIKYFISQCIHNGEVPLWFNTWGMGFPLQSNLTWGIYSFPQMFFASLFNYNIYVLHIEFMFYILLAGWSMFYLLKTHFLKDERVAQVLACCYMLSGFSVGSSQWFFDITAAAFIPLVMNALLQLLKSPSLKNSFFFSVMYSFMFTSIYIPLSIISTYCIIIFSIYWIIKTGKDKAETIKTIRFLFIGGFFTVILCLPCLLYTIEVLQNINRGNPIANNLHFFNSNYVPPQGLLSIFLPLSSARMSVPNTEGTMFNSYMGLFVLLAIPLASITITRNKNRKILTLGIIAIFFLLVSFGGVLPLRNLLNVLPGFSYFRHAGIFRFFFILFIILFLASSFSNKKWDELFNFSSNKNEGQKIKWITGLLMIVFIISFFSQVGSFKNISFNSLQEKIKNLSLSNAIVLNSIIQIFFLGLLFIFIRRRKYSLLKITFAADLIVNTFLCTPYFTVSSYSLPEVNNILHSANGFPTQTKSLVEAQSIFTDAKNNRWPNVNVFHKEISANPSYLGPLVLKKFSAVVDDSSKRNSSFNHLPVFTEGRTFYDSNLLKIIAMWPTHVSARVNLIEKTKIIFLQNYFPGWKAYYNNNYIEFTDSEKPGLTISVPSGKGVIDFKYDRKDIWFSAFLLHLITISFLVYCVIKFVQRNFMRSSSLS